MMETPICDFVRRYAEQNPLRLHMPGHKGTSLLGMEAMDITEVEGADVLHHADGIIRRSMEHASELFGTAKTVYSTEGSSLCIRAMLYLARLHATREGKAPLIAAGRNAHKTFMTAAALLDLQVDWLYPEINGSLHACILTANDLEQYLSCHAPCAVYLTSPDYLGNISDIAALSAVCRRHNTLLLVDNAHGAYLNFLPDNRHPMALGADLCCDSAHKTLPALTGAAYLHLSCQAPEELVRQADYAMSIFASTSPSYLILQSLDAVNVYLAGGYRRRLIRFTAEAVKLRQRFTAMGFVCVGNEPLKLTLAAKPCGYTGTELADYLLSKDIVCEFSDPDYLVMMLTPETTVSGLERLEQALAELPRLAAKPGIPPALPKPEQVCSIREAMFAPSVELPVEQCLGKVLASANISCPPAIPIVVCGERITEEAIACLQYYGVHSCRVTEA